MWVAILINTFHGRFEPFGPFGSKEEAEYWVAVQPRHISGATFTVIRVKSTDEGWG